MEQLSFGLWERMRRFGKLALGCRVISAARNVKNIWAIPIFLILAPAYQYPKISSDGQSESLPQIAFPRVPRGSSVQPKTGFTKMRTEEPELSNPQCLGLGFQSTIHAVVA